MTRGGSPALLEMRGITKAFPGVVALRDVDFDLRAGEVHVLVGENGAGKSTLIKILSGVHRADRGMIFLEGREVHIGSPREAQHAGISTVYQELNLIPQLRVDENLFLGQEPAGPFGWIDRIRRARAAESLLRSLEVPVGVSARVRPLGVAEQHGGPPSHRGSPGHSGCRQGREPQDPHHGSPARRRKAPPGGHHHRRHRPDGADHGAVGVRAAINILSGRQVPPQLFTPVFVVTKRTVDQVDFTLERGPVGWKP